MVHIPFKGGAPATQALLAGDTQLMFDNLANAMPQVKAGKLKALAVTTAQRSKLAPELPTMAEAGLPGIRHLDVVRPARAGRHAAGRRSRDGTRDVTQHPRRRPTCASGSPRRAPRRRR